MLTLKGSGSISWAIIQLFPVVVPPKRRKKSLSPEITQKGKHTETQHESLRQLVETHFL